jgi:hypothetical protein
MFVNRKLIMFIIVLVNQIIERFKEDSIAKKCKFSQSVVNKKSFCLIVQHMKARQENFHSLFTV